jgi:hypothetical protein
MNAIPNLLLQNEILYRSISAPKLDLPMASRRAQPTWMFMLVACRIHVHLIIPNVPKSSLRIYAWLLFLFFFWLASHFALPHNMPQLLYIVNPDQHEGTCVERTPGRRPLYSLLITFFLNNLFCGILWHGFYWCDRLINLNGWTRTSSLLLLGPTKIFNHSSYYENIRQCDEQ